MNNNYKIVIAFVVLVAIQVSFSMEPKQEAKIDKSENQVAVAPYSPFDFSFIPTFGNVSGCFAKGLESFANTVTNQISDDAAFRKLGWPLSDSVAKTELARTHERYKQILAEQNPQLRQECLSTILNRTSYLTRAYVALAKRPDGVSFAEHCIKEHSCAMSEPLKRLFTEYLVIKEAESARASNRARKMQSKDGDQNELTMISSCAITGADSLPIEVKNGLPDAEILFRIGWAFGERAESAKNYLQKCCNVYKIKQALRATKTRELLQTKEGRESLHITESNITDAMIKDPVRCRRCVEKREDFIKKIYLLLSLRPDGVQLAAHCLKFHTYVMAKYLKEDFFAFIEEKKQLTADIFNELLVVKNTDHKVKDEHLSNSAGNS